MASAAVPKIDTNDPNVRRLVYNMYRDMLGSYNNQASGIVESLPSFIRSQDEGVGKKLELIMKSNVDSPDSSAPPAPPPPPLGSFPGRRLNTEMHEPPAAIQNAMMTKDKKPFTYTPGGLDLSQIKSPRMQKRISRNADGGGVPAPTTQYTAQGPISGPLPPAAVAAMQPQTPVAVFPPPPPPPAPTGGPSPVNNQFKNQTTLPKKPLPQQQGFDPNEILARRAKYQDSSDTPPSYASPPPPPERMYVPQAPKPSEAAPVYIPSPPIVINTIPKSEMGSIYVAPVAKNEPASIYIPPVSAHQNKSQLGSIYIPPVDVSNQENNSASAGSSHSYIVQTPSTSGTPGSSVQKAPPSWLAPRIQPPSTVPPWANNSRNESVEKGSRVIPIQIEGQDQRQIKSPQQIKANNASQQANQWPQSKVPSPQQQQQEQQRQTPPTSSTRIIPIQMEGGGVVGQSPTSQMRQPNKFNPMTPQSPTPYSPPNFQEGNEQTQLWAHVQPQPFKNLQKPPGTDRRDGTSSPQRQPQASNMEYGAYNTAGVPLSQLRKMELSDDDRALMDKFKAQVDGENYLHKESDPRYRGASIPSRSFRMLQYMTDTAGDYQEQVPRGPPRGSANRVPQANNQWQQDGSTAERYVPPSEQQAHEPRIYTGSSIPSKSFKNLQASIGQDPDVSDM